MLAVPRPAVAMATARAERRPRRAVATEAAATATTAACAARDRPRTAPPPTASSCGSRSIRSCCATTGQVIFVNYKTFANDYKFYVKVIISWFLIFLKISKNS